MIYEQFLEQFTDWRPKTLTWNRFSIAEEYGKSEIQAVYDDVFKAAKKDYELLTELVMILNHKCWQHAEEVDNSKLCDMYCDLFYKTKEYAMNTLEGDEMRYFLNVID